VGVQGQYSGEKGRDVKRDMTPLDIGDMTTDEAVQKVAAAPQEMGVEGDGSHDFHGRPDGGLSPG
jgi:hypothetical protein